MANYSIPIDATISESGTPNIYALIKEGINNCLDDAAVMTNNEKAEAGWMTALLLVEISPACQNELLKKGYLMGAVSQDIANRIDANAAFRASSLKYAILHVDDNFKDLISNAMQEVYNATMN